MLVDLTTNEMHLAVLSLARMRMEIDVDGNGKCQTMNVGQAQACRFTMPFVDRLSEKLNLKMKEALGEPR